MAEKQVSEPEGQAMDESVQEEDNKKPSSMAVMALNDTKAGMEGLDKDKINKIIQEASKGSKFYLAKQKSQQRIDRQVEDMKRSMDKLSKSEVARATREADIAIQNMIDNRDLSRTIVHVDMDAFYAAVEMRDNPDLKEVPMAVGGTGMLSTSNYLARRYGVRAGMPGFIGKKLCPQLVLVPLNFDKYRAVSQVIRGVFAEYDPNFSPMSLDEAYLDITDYLTTRPGLGAEAVVNELRGKIQERTQLTASAGIASNCMLAKICSDLNKPNGQYRLRPDAETIMEFMRDLPIRKVSGVGNVTEQQLSAVGAKTCRDLYEKRGYLKLLFSDIAFSFFLRISQGIGSVKLPDWSERERKSLSTETTFRDTADFAKLSEICANLSSDLAEDLQKKGLQGKQVTLKIKTHRFQNKSKVTNLTRFTDDASAIEAAAISILRHFAENIEEKPLKLRLMGVRVSDFKGEGEEEDCKQRKLDSFFKHPKSNKEQDDDASSGKTPAETKKTFFDCPVCLRKVEAKSEYAFNREHLDQCLAGGGVDGSTQPSRNDHGGLQQHSGKRPSPPISSVEESYSSEKIKEKDTLRPAGETVVESSMEAAASSIHTTTQITTTKKDILNGESKKYGPKQREPLNIF